MEQRICQDTLSIIYQYLSFDMKNIILTCKYFYKTFQLHKKQLCHGNYILTTIQKRMIKDMMYHIEHPMGKSLIIQSNVSTGKTAACLAFAMTYEGTTIIIVPSSILPQWYNEVIKMYGNDGFKKIAMVNDKYMTSQDYNRCKYNLLNPFLMGYKIFIISNAMRYDIHRLTEHSVVIIDEVHTKGAKINHSKVIGITASNAMDWYHAVNKIYTEEEWLPELVSHNLHIEPHSIHSTIQNIKKQRQGPYLILCSTALKYYIQDHYIEYHRNIETLNKMNKMTKDQIALLCPEKDSTGINLTNINTIIFIYPTKHINETVIQSIGRATRATSKNKKISVFNFHETREDIILHRSTLSENTIIHFCKQHHLTMIKNPRHKGYATKVIKQLIDLTSYDKVYQIPPIYITLICRIIKKQYPFLTTIFMRHLSLSESKITYILNRRG